MKSSADFKKLFPLLYGLLIFLIYLSLINNSKGYEYDASNIARWSDSGRFVAPSQQNHMLQSILNMSWCKIWKFFGYDQGCLMPLRILSCIFGSLGVAGFFILLRKIFKENGVAIFGSLSLGFSVLYWGFSTDLETHLLPTAIFIYCLVLLFSSGNLSVKKILLLGLIHSFCIYLSGIYIFFAPAIIIVLAMAEDSRRNRGKSIGWYLFSLAIFWFAPFFITGLYFYKADSGLKYADNIAGHLFIWFRGFEKLIPFLSNNLFKLPFNYFGTIHAITKLNKTMISIGIIFSLFYLFLLLIFIKNIKNITAKFSKVIIAALCLIIPYQLTLLIYEPLNVQRCTHFLPALWLMGCSALHPLFLKKTKLIFIPFIFIALLFSTNLIFYIYPRHSVSLGPLRRDILNSLNFKADNLSKEGRLQEASEKLIEALDVLAGTFGDNHPEIAKTLDKLAQVYEKMQLKEKSQWLKIRAQEIRDKRAK